MLEAEARLFDEYKRVDNICRDMYSSQSGVSQYITEMELHSFRGRSTVLSWDEDYRKLKYIRWLRNQIAHNSSATDCNDEDVEWLENFHCRLLKCQDPLALLENANRERLKLLENSNRKQLSLLGNANQERSNLLENTNQERLSFSPQCEYELNTEAEQKILNNDQFDKKKKTSLKWIVTLLIGIASVAVFLILYFMINM